MNINTLLNTGTDHSIGILVLRIGTGITLAAHGAQKLFGWFGGYGLEATGQWMASIGITPGFLMALLAGSAEFFGGLALALGLLTRPAAAITAFTMLVALFSVHFANGFFLSNNGYEYALALATSSIAIMLTGAGKFSLDNLLIRQLSKK